MLLIIYSMVSGMENIMYWIVFKFIRLAKVCVGRCHSQENSLNMKNPIVEDSDTRG
jgi:hypothetical protein